jgi:hypothetical protein
MPGAANGSAARNTQIPAVRAAGIEKPWANPARLATAAAMAEPAAAPVSRTVAMPAPPMARSSSGQLAERAAREQPYFVNALRVAAASNALAGRLDEARQCMARALRLDPGMRVSNLKDRLGGRFPPVHFVRFVDGLRRAGLPE